MDIRSPIVQIAKNPHFDGKDYVIGDIHGSKAAFIEVLNKLGPHDRLFIVGDLTDRGEDSAGIIHLINAKIDTGQAIYTVRGNHEDMFLDGVQAVRRIKTSEEASPVDLQAVFHQINNGGHWIFSDNNQANELKRLTKQIIALFQIRIRTKNDRDKIEEEKNRLVDEFKNLLRQAALIEDVDIVREYMESLPYIIRVGNRNDDDAFIVCHADLPFSDDELENKNQLSEEDIKYLTWTRAHTINSRRDNSSVRVYCGHSIVGDGREHAVREKTNTINLDGGAYYTKQFILVNHTDKKAEIVCAANTNPEASLQKQIEIINEHLNPTPFFEKHPWVKRALIGAAIGAAVGLVIVGVIAIVAATSGTATPFILGVGAVIGGHLGLKAGLVIGGVAIVSAFGFLGSIAEPVTNKISEGLSWLGKKLFPVHHEVVEKEREDEQKQGRDHDHDTNYIYTNLHVHGHEDAVVHEELRVESKLKSESKVEVVKNPSNERVFENTEKERYKRISI